MVLFYLFIQYYAVLKEIDRLNIIIKMVLFYLFIQYYAVLKEIDRLDNA